MRYDVVVVGSGFGGSVVHLIAIRIPSPGMSVVPSGFIRAIPGGDGFFEPFGNVRAGSFTWSTKLSQVDGVQLCSVGGP